MNFCIFFSFHYSLSFLHSLAYTTFSRSQLFFAFLSAMYILFICSPASKKKQPSDVNSLFFPCDYSESLLPAALGSRMCMEPRNMKRKEIIKQIIEKKNMKENWEFSIFWLLLQYSYRRREIAIWLHIERVNFSIFGKYTYIDERIRQWRWWWWDSLGWIEPRECLRTFFFSSNQPKNMNIFLHVAILQDSFSLCRV